MSQEEDVLNKLKNIIDPDLGQEIREYRMMFP